MLAFLVSFLLAVSIPLFAVGYTLLFIAWVAPLATYILMRNGRVTDEQKVLTPAHLKVWLAGLASGRKRRASHRHVSCARARPARAFDSAEVPKRRTSPT